MNDENKNVPTVNLDGSGDAIDVINKAVDIARHLKDIIEKQKLYTQIGPNKHVNIEGWQVCGAMLGAFPRECYVDCHENGSYEAKVEIWINNRPICSASSLCGIDENPWGKRPRFARRSMAITRAASKAYRISFGFLMNMAGYSATPYEEMNETTILTSVDPDLAIYDQNNNNHKTKLANMLVQSGRLTAGEKDRMLKASEHYNGKTFKFIKSELGLQ